MKKYLLFSILYLLFFVPVAQAAHIATNTFYVSAQNTISIVTSGTLSGTIDSDGIISNPLNINFRITTSEDLSGIQLKAFVLDDKGQSISAFKCGSTTPSPSANACVVLADFYHRPTAASILDCECNCPECSLNPDSIAYPGTISISEGTVAYVDNSGSGYFNCEVPSGVVDLSLVVATTPKPGTFSAENPLDEADPYRVEVFLDNIPE